MRVDARASLSLKLVSGLLLSGAGFVQSSDGIDARGVALELEQVIRDDYNAAAQLMQDRVDGDGDGDGDSHEAEGRNESLPAGVGTASASAVVVPRRASPEKEESPLRNGQPVGAMLRGGGPTIPREHRSSDAGAAGWEQTGQSEQEESFERRLPGDEEEEPEPVRRSHRQRRRILDMDEKTFYERQNVTKAEWHRRLRDGRKKEKMAEALRRISLEGPSASMERRRRLLQDSGVVADEGGEVDVLKAIANRIEQQRQQRWQRSGGRRLDDEDGAVGANVGVQFFILTALSPGAAPNRPEDIDEYYCAGVPEGALDNVFVFQRPALLVLRHCFFSEVADVEWAIPTDENEEDIDDSNTHLTLEDGTSVVQPWPIRSRPRMYNYQFVCDSNGRNCVLIPEPPYIIALNGRNTVNNNPEADVGEENYVDWYNYWMSAEEVEKGEPVLADRRSIYDLDPTDFQRWNFLAGPALDTTWRPDLEEEGFGGYKQRYCVAVKGGKSKKKKKKKNRNRKSRRRRQRRLNNNNRNLEGRRISLEECSEKSTGRKRQRQTWIYCGTSNFCELVNLETGGNSPPEVDFEVIDVETGETVDTVQGQIDSDYTDDSWFIGSNDPCTTDDDDLTERQQEQIGGWASAIFDFEELFPSANDRDNNRRVDIVATSRCQGGGNSDTGFEYNLQTIVQFYQRICNNDECSGSNPYSSEATCPRSGRTDCFTPGNDPTEGIDQSDDDANRQYTPSVTFQNVNIRRGVEYRFRLRGATRAVSCDTGDFTCAY